MSRGSFVKRIEQQGRKQELPDGRIACPICWTVNETLHGSSGEDGKPTMDRFCSVSCFAALSCKPRLLLIQDRLVSGGVRQRIIVTVYSVECPATYTFGLSLRGGRVGLRFSNCC